MRRRLRIAAAALALLALTSCSRIFLVTAVFVDGALTFVSEDDERTHTPWCWHDFTVIRDDGEPVWAFEVPFEAYRDDIDCGPNFPIVYGRGPPRAETHIGHRPLEPGRLYVITGNSGGMLEGAFTLTRSAGRVWIDNLDPNSAAARDVEQRNREWRSAHEPPRRTYLGEGISDHEMQEPKDLIVPRNPSAGPAGADDYTWLLNESPRSNFPSLSYATLDGRNIVMDLWCRWRGAVILGRMTPWSLNGNRLELVSGEHRLAEQLSGSGEGDDPFMVGAVLAENDPVLRNFGMTGRLSMRVGGREVALDAVNDRERRTVRNFFELCYVEKPHEPRLPWR